MFLMVCYVKPLVESREDRHPLENYLITDLIATTESEIIKNLRSRLTKRSTPDSKRSLELITIALVITQHLWETLK